MNYDSILDFCHAINKGGLGITAITITIPSMNKTNNPFYGRLYKATLTTDMGLGMSYDSSVEQHLKKEGLDTDGWETQKPTGKHWVEAPFILASDKDENVKYLRTYKRSNTKQTSIFILDGEVVEDDATIAQIKTFIKSSSSSAKQEAMGLSKEKQVKPLDYRFESIIFLMQGEERQFTAVSEMDVVEVKKHFQ